MVESCFCFFFFFQWGSLFSSGLIIRPVFAQSLLTAIHLLCLYLYLYLWFSILGFEVFFFSFLLQEVLFKISLMVSISLAFEFASLGKFPFSSSLSLSLLMYPIRVFTISLFSSEKDWIFIENPKWWNWNSWSRYYRLLILETYYVDGSFQVLIFLCWIEEKNSLLMFCEEEEEEILILV